MTIRQAGPKGPTPPKRGRPENEVPVWACFGLWRMVRHELRGSRDVAAACARLTAKYRKGIVRPTEDGQGCAPIFDAHTLRTRFNEIEKRRHEGDDEAQELNRLCTEWEARNAASWSTRELTAARAAAAELSLQASERAGLFTALQFWEMSERANAAADLVKLDPSAPPVPRKNRR